MGKSRFLEDPILSNLIISSIPDIILIWEIESGKLQFINDQAENILGYTKEDLSDLDKIRILLHPEDINRVSDFFSCVRDSRMNQDLVVGFRFRKRGGEYVYLENRIVVLDRDPNQKVQKVLIYAQDRTSIYESQLRLEKILKINQDANKEKSTFLANISHELKTPLNSILGYAEFLLMPGMQKLSEQQRLYLRTIQSSGQYLLGLMNDILSYSSIELDKIPLNRKRINLTQFLGEIIDSFLIIASENRIIFEFEIDDSLPEMDMDPMKLRQAISNLITNAIKFTPPEKRFGIKATKCSGSIQIIVWDEGIGIAPEHQIRIFEPFEQVSSKEKGKNVGTGLGLSICKKFIELHGGSIKLMSKLGEGSQFIVEFPVPLENRS
jgi:PAS domain S-box-containing protein